MGAAISAGGVEEGTLVQTLQVAVTPCVCQCWSRGLCAGDGTGVPVGLPIFVAATKMRCVCVCGWVTQVRLLAAVSRMWLQLATTGV